MTERKFDTTDLKGLDCYIEKNKDEVYVVAYTYLLLEIGDIVESLLKFGKRNNLESKGILINVAKKNDPTFGKYYELKGMFIDRFYKYNI